MAKVGVAAPDMPTSVLNKLKAQTQLLTFFFNIVPELRRGHGLRMSRPKRKAAEAAVERIQHILAWESAPESSKLFKTCAAAIDA